MIHKCTSEQRRQDGFGMWHADAMQLLRGEAFRIYCYLMGCPTEQHNGTPWKIHPKKIALDLGISKKTVMNAFREMKDKGFMEFETDTHGRILTTINEKGQVARCTEYIFYETPSLKRKPVEKGNRCKKETGVKSTQETGVKSTQETGVKSTQVAINNMTLDQKELNQIDQIKYIEEKESIKEKRSSSTPPRRKSRKKHMTGKPGPDEKPYGEFQQVFLSDKAYTSVLKYFQGDQQELTFWIEKLDLYLKNTPERAFGGKKAYVDHGAALRTFKKRSPGEYQRYLTELGQGRGSPKRTGFQTPFERNMDGLQQAYQRALHEEEHDEKNEYDQTFGASGELLSAIPGIRSATRH